MGVNKSILQELELDNGLTVYVQAGNGKHVSFSVDGANTQYVFTMTVDELVALRDTINATLEEISQL